MERFAGRDQRRASAGGRLPYPMPSSKHAPPKVAKAVERALDEVGQFIRDLAVAPSEPFTPPAPNDLWVSFSSSSLGWVWLNGPEAERYYKIIRQLGAATMKRPSLGRRWITSSLHKAILQAVDIVDAQKGVPLEARITAALKELKSTLEAPPIPWEIYLPIEGMAPPRRPFRVGDATFRRLSARGIRRLARADRVLVPKIVLEEWNRPRAVAHFKLRGYEGGAVNAEAREATARLLDVLNFYSDIVQPPKSRSLVYLPGEAPSGRDQHFHLIHNPEPIVSQGAGRTRGVEDFDITQLSGSRGRRAGAARALELLRSAAPNSFAQRVIVALQWAGRATAEPRLEMSLLLYLISLEALLLSPDSGELKHRLCVRLAHVLGRTRAARLDYYKRASDLYDVRSKIVHTGRLGVTSAEHAAARHLAKNAIVAFLVRRELRSLERPADVDRWFLGRVFR